VTALLWLAALPCLYWTQGVESAPALKKAAIERVCVPADQADAWQKAGFTAVPVTDTDLGLRETLAPPGIRPRADRASATRSPWVFTNGSRFLRDPAGKFVYDLPAGKGRVIAFNFNPVYRDLNHSDYRLLWNGILNWNALPPQQP